MSTATRLAFRLIGVGAGLVLRVFDEISEVFHGETDWEYIQRKYPEGVSEEWTDGDDPYGVGKYIG